MLPVARTLVEHGLVGVINSYDQACFTFTEGWIGFTLSSVDFGRGGSRSENVNITAFVGLFVKHLNGRGPVEKNGHSAVFHVLLIDIVL